MRRGAIILLIGVLLGALPWLLWPSAAAHSQSASEPCEIRVRIDGVQAWVAKPASWCLADSGIAPPPTTTATVAPSATSPTPTVPAATSTPTPPGGDPQPLAPVSGYRLVFSDEFDGAALDTAKWQTCYPYGCRNDNNGELQWYTADNVAVSGGTLRLTARRESANGYAYTSGVVTSYGAWHGTYGYFEARMKLPAGRGLWPGFWTSPYPGGWPPEIDVMENLGQDPTTIYHTYHYADSGGAHRQVGGTTTGIDFSAGFHVVGCEWTPEAIVWYVDGVERLRTAPRQVAAMYVLANLAVGGDWPGSPDASTPFPSVFELDWIRVYQK